MPPTVMHVIPGFNVGGAESMLASLVTAERADAPRQVVVDLLAGGIYVESVRAAGIAVHELDIRRSWGGPKAVARLAKLIREEQPDVIQSWMYHGDLLATLGLLRSGRRRRTRLYWGVRCSYLDAKLYGLALRLVISACVRLSRVPDAILANSHAGRSVHRLMGYRTQKFLVVPNGIDVDRFRPDERARQAIRGQLGISPEAKVAILPARIDPMKDHETFLAVVDRLPDVMMLAVGADTQFLPERPNMICLGTRLDMPSLYAASDVVISSSAFGEGFSNALGEGMAAGLPAVATDVGDAKRIIGDTGLVVPLGDAAALADAVRAIVDESPAATQERRGRARRRIAEDFSVGRAVAEFDRIHCRGV